MKSFSPILLCFMKAIKRKGETKSLSHPDRKNHSPLSIFEEVRTPLTDEDGHHPPHLRVSQGRTRRLSCFHGHFEARGRQIHSKNTAPPAPRTALTWRSTRRRLSGGGDGRDRGGAATIAPPSTSFEGRPVAASGASGDVEGGRERQSSLPLPPP